MFNSFSATTEDEGKNDNYIKVYDRKQISSVENVNNNSMFPTLFFDWNIFNVSDTEIQSTEGTKTILFYNVPGFMRNMARKDISFTNCEYKNCIISRNFSKLSTADALIFYVGIRDEQIGIDPPMLPRMRNPNQVWVFTSNEPPEHYYNTEYRSLSWQNTMNWSMFYRLDSDIPNPYGCLIKQEKPEQKDYDAIFEAKTKNALWPVSHCHVSSERKLYIKKMKEHGFNVDIVGGCSENGKKLSNQEFEALIPTYKYYIAFENSFCHDYVTEKFFQNYNASWILVVRGGADYRRLLPENTYINTADFTNISSLVDYLTELGNDKERYTRFLRNKDHYYSIRWPNNRNCEICRRLNNLEKYRKTYRSMVDFISGQCHRPTDL